MPNFNDNRHSFDAHMIISMLEEKRNSKKPKDTIDDLAEKLGISPSSYKRFLAGDTDALAKNMEMVFQICVYLRKMLFQLCDLIPEDSMILSIIEKIFQLSESNQYLLNSFVNGLINDDPEQTKKIFSKAALMEAVSQISICYYKILKVNLTTGVYEPVYVKNAEWDLLPEEKTYLIANWFQLFIDYEYIHPDDVKHFEENANLYALKTLMRFTSHDSSIHYRRKMNDTYKPVCMEIIKCADYTSDHQNILLCVRDKL